MPDAEGAALRARWKEAFGVPVPRHAQAKFLRLALAWHDQMQASAVWRGKAGRDRLKRLLRGAPSRVQLLPGTRLVREWQGDVYQVLVLPKGFEMDGKVYKSLSAIARTITGTPWSGPLFFGVD